MYSSVFFMCRSTCILSACIFMFSSCFILDLNTSNCVAPPFLCTCLESTYCILEYLKKYIYISIVVVLIFYRNNVTLKVDNCKMYFQFPYHQCASFWT